jgi:serine/threonine protein kinase
MFDIEQLQNSLLPRVQASDNLDQKCTSPFDFVFPPFAITEWGESLFEWVSRSAPDLPTTIFVLLHVAERLQQLHEAGWAHRKLRPAHVWWRPQTNSWTLVDFGGAARLGEHLVQFTM